MQYTENGEKQEQQDIYKSSCLSENEGMKQFVHERRPALRLTQ